MVGAAWTRAGGSKPLPRITLLPTPSPPVELEPPSFAESFSFFLLLLLFGCAPPPVAAFRDPAPHRATSNCLDASTSTGLDCLPEPSGLVGAREGAGADVIEVPESVGGLEDEGAVDVACPGDVDG